MRVFQKLLDILVKTHAFLNQHMWWIFIAPRLMSPLATNDEGQDLKKPLLPVWESSTWMQPRSFSHTFALCGIPSSDFFLFFFWPH